MVPHTSHQDEFPALQGSSLSWKHGSPNLGQAIQPQQLIPVKERLPTDSRGERRLTISAFTLNAQSLHGKHRLLEEQLAKLNITMVAFQETKENGGYVESREFLRMGFPSNQHWGTAVWIRRRQLMNGHEVTVDKTNVNVICSEPRLTAVVLTVGSFRVLFGSCHVPQQAKGADERTAILAQVAGTVRKHGGTCAVIFGFDANARVPMNVGKATGDFLFGSPDEAGREFAMAVDGMRLQLPTTFRSIHHGESYTWRHASGNYSRIDYFAVGGEGWFENTSTMVRQDIDTLCAADDHWPAHIATTVLATRRQSGETSPTTV